MHLTETIVKRLHEIDFNSRHGGEFRLIVYVNQVEYAEHIALVKGDISDGGPVHVRMHSLNVLADLLGDRLVNRMIGLWLETEFEGGRHARRVEKIGEYEAHNGTSVPSS